MHAERYEVPTATVIAAPSQVNSIVLAA